MSISCRRLCVQAAQIVVAAAREHDLYHIFSHTHQSNICRKSRFGVWPTRANEH